MASKGKLYAKEVVVTKSQTLLKRAFGTSFREGGYVENGEKLKCLPLFGKETSYIRVEKENGISGYINKRDVKIITPC